MSKHTLSSRKISRPRTTDSRMFDALENRTLMSVGPASIPGATVNDTVFENASNTLHAIYYNVQDKTLNYQGFHTDGTADAAQVVDNSGDTGQYLSLTQDSTGVLHAAYYDVANGDLKYARRDLAGVWSTTTVASKNTTGLYPSIAIDADGKPAIAYYHKNTGDLNFAKFDGTTWAISTIVSTNDVGRYPSLALNPTTNTLAIGFEDTTLGHFKFAEQGAGGWTITTVDSATKQGGGYISMAFNGGNPAMSYYDAFNADLKYAERSSRGKWTATTVAAKNSQGLYTDLAFTYDTNQPAIVYYNKTQDSIVLGYRTAGGTWNFETQITGGGRNLAAADGVSVGGEAPDLYLTYTDTGTFSLKVDTL